MSRAYIALGSNVGDRGANIAAAIAALAATHGIVVLRVAEPIETDPVDCPPGSGSFLNTAAVLDTTLAPTELLGLLHDVEQRLNRERLGRNAPRTIDLDILMYDDYVVDSPHLALPHPRMHQRRFVLAPLAAVAPDAVHPVLRKTIAALLSDLDASDSST